MTDPFADPRGLVDRVYAYAAYRLASTADAEDVVGEAIERALRYRSSYDSRRGDPVAWVIGIARRCIADRTTRNEPEVLEGVASPWVDSHDSRSIRALELREALAQLADRDREIIALRFGADLSAREIADVLELRTNTVEVALHRALARLREELTPTASRRADPRSASAPDATYS
jgi:RNA polymerase sigma-70 factor (ECF subfamily)